MSVSVLLRVSIDVEVRERKVFVNGALVHESPTNEAAARLAFNLIAALDTVVPMIRKDGK